MFRNVIKLNVFNVTSVQYVNRSCCYCTTTSVNNDLIQFFKNNLGLNEKEIIRIAKKFPSFNNNNYNFLFEKYSQLLNFGISNEDIIKKIQVLTLHPLTVKNHIMLLEEGGFIKSKIKPNILLRYKYISKTTIFTLKNENYIPHHIDVHKNLLSFTQLPIELYPNEFNDLLTWEQVHKSAFELYIKWKLRIDSDDLNYAKAVYYRLSNKSYRLVERTIDILLNTLNFSLEKIARNAYLIHSDPDNTLAILSNFKHLGGMDTITFLSKHPKVIITPWKTIFEIQKKFEEFGIPESALAKAPEIYTLGSDSVYKRLKTLKETPELAAYLSNPQVARLVYYFKKANLRLEYLQSKNCLSLNLLVTNNTSFKRFNTNGNDKGKTNDIMIYLTKELDKSKQEMRIILERHSYWQYISLLTIRTTYEFLKDHFTKEQIYNSLPILLYSVDKIKDALVISQNMKDVSYLRNSAGLIKPECILPLVLYNLEKKFHFSGNGVWSSYEENKILASSESHKSKLEDTEELDHEPVTRYM